MPKIEFSEKQIEITFGDGMSVVGRIDLVRRIDTGETTIVDLKSTDRAHVEDVTQAQLHVYALGYQELTGRRPDYVEIYKLDERKRKPCSVDDEFIADVKVCIWRATDTLRFGSGYRRAWGEEVRKLRLPRHLLGGAGGRGSGSTSTAEATKVLRTRIVRSLRKQGFRLCDGHLVPPDPTDKEQLRRLHEEAVRHRVATARAGLKRHEDRLLGRIAAGSEVTPEDIRPRLVEVQPGSEEELLFRYARLHWSIPVSAGYGRRLRFVVIDESNGKLIGLFGLGDPVFSLGPRDQWIGWDAAQRKTRLKNVMDLFVLGAVPPYSRLLCGKLIALLATSREVQQAFRRKYEGKPSVISQSPLDGRLALLTTTSALGRSSLYNRLTYRSQPVYHSVGFTRGSGEFHFSNGFYADLRALALEHCHATAKHSRWGTGFRNKRELLRKALPLLGLSSDLLYHGVRREIFVVPLAHNAAAFLRGEDQQLMVYNHTADDLFAWFRERWLLPRAARDQTYRTFDPETYRLWRSP